MNTKEQEKTTPSKPRRSPRIAAVIHKIVGDDKKVFLSRVLFLLGPLVALFQVELLNETNPYLNLEPDEFIMNMVWYAIAFFISWLIFGRRRRAAVAACCFFEVIGIINHYVLEFRGRILFPHDIAAIRTAVNVVDEYDFTPDKYIWGTLALMLLYFLVLKLFAVPQPERSYFKKKTITWIMGALSAAYIVAFFFTGWLPAAGIKTQQWRTQSNGFVLNFTIALRYSRVDKPDNYSEETITDQAQEVTSTHTDENPEMNLQQDTFLKKGTGKTGQTSSSTVSSGVQPTNLICIMDESFADMSIYDRLQVNEEVIPFFKSLKNNTVKGWMYSPVTGGGTANVEYEFLTGNSSAFLPSGTVPYQLYVKDNQASLVSLAKSMGYHTTAFHPYLSSGWNRPLVYKYMGFDKQMFDTDVTNPEYVRGYISDSCDFKTIQSITEQGKGQKNFIFNVTMQNHGGYNQGWYNLPRTIALKGTMFGTSSYTEQYLALMRKTDDALKELIDYYSKVDEPTMIVLFGDHQGKLTTAFYEQLFGKSTDNPTMEETQREYVTPFMIWANYDIPEAENVMLSTNYLGVLTAKMANLPMTDYMKYLADLYEQVPVINTNGYITPDGKMTEDLSDLSETLQSQVKQYQAFAFCDLFSRFDYMDGNFFRLHPGSQDTGTGGASSSGSAGSE